MTDARALLSEASRELARFPQVLDLLVGDLDEGTCRSRPAPDEWAPVEIICHLRADRPNGGRLSGLDLLAAWVTHDRLHLHQLAGTLARLWASRWGPLQTDYAGPIPYVSP